MYIDYTVLLAHWGRRKMAPFCRRDFQSNFPEWKLLYIEWNLFPMDQVTINETSKEKSIDFSCVSTLLFYTKIRHRLTVSMMQIVPACGYTSTWNNADLLYTRPPGTKFNEIWTKTHFSSFKEMHSKMSSAKLRPLCYHFHVLTDVWT